MKRYKELALLLALCLLLSGCGQLPPEQAADGQPWQDSWITVGNLLGVDTPEGLTPRENNQALAANGMYYATWSAGEGRPYVNAEGEDATVYDAQLYVLLAEEGDKAQQTLDSWLAMAQEQYTVVSSSQVTGNGQDYTLLTYTYPDPENPYSQGASVFALYGPWAVSIELSCAEGFEDPQGVLLDFLNHCHYGAQ